MEQDVSHLNKLCVVCGKELGPYTSEHCTDRSLVAVSRGGFLKRSVAFLDLNGTLLSDDDITHIKETEAPRVQSFKMQKTAASLEGLRRDVSQVPRAGLEMKVRHVKATKTTRLKGESPGLTEVRTWHFNDFPVWCSRFSADGTKLAAGFQSRGEGAFVWSVDEERVKVTRVPAQSLKDAFGSRVPLVGDLRNNVQSVAFVQEDRQLLLAIDGDVRAYDLETQRLIWQYPKVGGRKLRREDPTIPLIFSVAASDDGQIVVAGGARPPYALEVLDPRTGSVRRSLRGHQDGIQQLAVSGDGHVAFSSSKDKTARIWDIPSGKCVQIFEVVSDVKCLALSHDGGRAILAESKKGVRLFDVRTGREQIIEGDSQGGVAILPDSEIALSGSGSLLRLWDCDAMRELTTVKCGVMSIWSIACSPNGEHVAVSDSFGTISLLSVRYGLPMASRPSVLGL